MLPLKGIKQNATYRCMQGAEILSETILTIGKYLNSFSLFNFHIYSLLNYYLTYIYQFK